jgi:hypothetical protein
MNPTFNGIQFVFTGDLHGGFGLSFTNVSGASFTVYAVTNLAPPINWTVAGQPTEVPIGSYSQYLFTNPQATNKSMVCGFYGISSP